jgi:hypothetical protein
MFLVKPIIFATRVFSRHQGELMAFMATAMTSDVVAPPTAYAGGAFPSAPKQRAVSVRQDGVGEWYE